MFILVCSLTVCSVVSLGIYLIGHYTEKLIEKECQDYYVSSLS